MAVPTWASVDFGLNGTNGSDVRSFVRMQLGPIENRRHEVAFPGVDGIWVQPLGRGGRNVVWQLTVLGKTLTAINDIETALAAKLQKGAFLMVMQGRSLPGMELLSVEEAEPMTGLGGPFFSFLRKYVLTFRQLTP